MIFDYRCNSCAKTFERFVSSLHKDNVVCPDCGVKATRLISPPNFKLDGCDPSFPTAWDRWAKIHEKEGRRGREP